MEKHIFYTEQQEDKPQTFTPKQTFEQDEVVIETDQEIDIELQTGHTSTQFSQAIQPKSCWWKKGLISSGILFSLTLIAQSVQWLINAWQNQQWIYFSFALVSCSIIGLGISTMVNEWRKLVQLRKRQYLQKQSQCLLTQSAVDFQQDFSHQHTEKAQKLCKEIAKIMVISPQSPEFVQWQAQLNESTLPTEITYLFSQTVLKPIDLTAQKLISKNAVEAAAIVAITPLAIVDVFFIAWRNLRLINQLAILYHIELGYFSRLRLFKMVLLNMAFAGATEVVQDMGIDWLSQDLSAKLSSRIAQGIGVGLLTARLGINAMEFCRPIPFRKEEKPRLNAIHKEIFSYLTETLFLIRRK